MRLILSQVFLYGSFSQQGYARRGRQASRAVLYARNIMARQLLQVARSVLVVIDIQVKLARAMRPADRVEVLRNTRVLLEAAGRLGVPVLLTEQYPKGLGPTEPLLQLALPEGTFRIEKNSFSCCGESDFVTRLSGLRRRQVVLSGMEAHVCVLQTALELLDGGFEVFVVEDATCSRKPAHHRNAMERLRAAGVVIANTESVLFEWLREATHPEFKVLAALLK